MENNSLADRLKQWWYAPRSRSFYVQVMSLGLIVGISMRWLHQDFLSGFGIGITIAAAFLAAPGFRRS